jgi:hypothetical protein
MVYAEEKPLPKSEEQIAQEKNFEEAGSKSGGAEGAAAAGIALAPAPTVGDETEQDDSEDEQDVMKDAQSEGLGITSPVKEPEMVPLHSPAESPMVNDAETPPPPPPRMMMSDMPKDEVEMKHPHHEGEEEEEVDEDEDDAPPPPQRDIRRSIGGGEKPLGPRPLPSPGKVGVAPPLPPQGNPMVPPRDDSEDEREAEGRGDEDEEEEEAPPPPPARKPSVPVPARLQMPARSPSGQSPGTSHSGHGSTIVLTCSLSYHHAVPCAR